MNKQSDQKLVLDKRPENQTKTLKLPPPCFWIRAWLFVIGLCFNACRLTGNHFLITWELIFGVDTDFAWCTILKTVNIVAKFSCYNFIIYLYLSSNTRYYVCLMYISIVYFGGSLLIVLNINYQTVKN